jgi:hypothetical protein
VARSRRGCHGLPHVRKRLSSGDMSADLPHRTIEKGEHVRTGCSRLSGGGDTCGRRGGVNPCGHPTPRRLVSSLHGQQTGDSGEVALVGRQLAPCIHKVKLLQVVNGAGQRVPLQARGRLGRQHTVQQ